MAIGHGVPMDKEHRKQARRLGQALLKMDEEQFYQWLMMRLPQMGNSLNALVMCGMSAAPYVGQKKRAREREIAS